jgi:hypothetical protein
VRLLLLIAALALGGLTADAGAQPGGALALIVPAYFDPDSQWQQIAGAGPGTVMIVNPDSGPGASPTGAYRQAITAARAAGVELLAYVATGYGQRPLRAIERDLTRYRDWYGLRDVFFDEASSSPAMLARYRRITDYARAHGAQRIVLNPGDVPPRGYFALASTVVTFEDSYAHYLRASFPSWLHDYPAAAQANIVYAARGAAAGEHAVELARARGAGLVFVTDERLPNPYASLPGYFALEESWAAG